MHFRVPPPKRRPQGFTLLEIMLVVTIIALLMGAAIYKMGFGQLDFAKHTKITTDIQTISQQLQLYENLNGFRPSTEQGIRALIQQPESEPRPTRWYQFLKDMPKDPWQNDYIYRSPGIKNPNSYDLFSAGPDRKPDTADDDWGN